MIYIINSKLHNGKYIVALLNDSNKLDVETISIHRFIGDACIDAGSRQLSFIKRNIPCKILNDIKISVVS
jgi:hypothetical protein